MLDEKIIVKRVKQAISRVNGQWYDDHVPLQASFIHDQKEPIPYDVAVKAKYKAIKPGQQWARLWGSAWFRFTATVPKRFAGREVVALLDVGGEGCVFVDGSPVQGITSGDTKNLHWTKRLVPLHKRAKGGEKVLLLVEAGANGLFGGGQDVFRMGECTIACFNRKPRQLEYDMWTLLSLHEKLPEGSARREKVLRGLNDVANAWDGGRGIDTCLAITGGLLSQKATDSASTVYSIGHAHLDLGWLWPTRETKRKGGRTFSTALRLMEEYPEYKFGASQAQLYEWMREKYPALYERVKKAVQRGQWECQGAMWVEPDMNLAGGEALVRQCLYGKKLFMEDFGVDVRNLWLPDVFGYSAALPQILKKCGVDVFMTQKISWNETNTFPHHTFDWQGIDGTRIRTHFLPTNDYNCANWPSQLMDAEKRFAQNDVSSEYLNLFGVGDGGGGPSRCHIELGRRQQNLEGAPKFTFAKAEEFFRKILRIPGARLPLWVGELYLELHRGTYTTQALMKKHNRLLELGLRDTEFLCAVSGAWPKQELDRIWKNTLLNQFHDILPGSSITWVYKDASRESQANLKQLGAIRDKAVTKLVGKGRKTRGAVHVVHNTLSWPRTEVVRVPAPRGAVRAEDAGGEEIPSVRVGRELECEVTVPPMGHMSLVVVPGKAAAPGGARATRSTLENDLVKVTLGADGTIVSMYDKQAQHEALAGPANVLQLWEDLPYAFEAWDVSHYYRETKPEQAKRRSVRVAKSSGLTVAVLQEFTVGQSTVTQRISLTRGNRLVTVESTVDWTEERKMLRVTARPDVHWHEASFEIQYGTVRRPTHHNTSWDRARFEVAGHRFADLSQPDHGFAIVNDCKYGHSVLGNVMDLTLLRSSRSPDPVADMHTHTFTFGYLPHEGDLVQSGVLQAAHGLNAPLLVSAAPGLPAKPVRSHFAVHGDHVKIEAVKRAEDGLGLVLRLYETSGATATVTLEAEKAWKALYETDMLESEKGREKVAGAGNTVDLVFKPFEIRTFVLG